MATNKHDVELVRAHQRGELVKMVGGIFKMVLTFAFALGAIFLMLNGLKQISEVASARQITALSLIVDKFKLSDIVHYTIDGALIVSYCLQRRNCKKAIKDKAELQRQLQQGEPNRTSSNLTPTGETP